MGLAIVWDIVVLHVEVSYKKLVINCPTYRVIWGKFHSSIGNAYGGISCWSIVGGIVKRNNYIPQ